MKERVPGKKPKSKTKKKRTNYDQLLNLRFILVLICSPRKLKIQGFISENQNFLGIMSRKVTFCTDRCLGKYLFVCEPGIPPGNIPKDKSLLELIMIKKNHTKLGQHFDYFLKFYFCNYDTIMEDIEVKLGKRSQNVENIMNLRNRASFKKVCDGSQHSKRRSASEPLRNDPFSNQIEKEVFLILSEQILNNRTRISSSENNKNTKTKGKSHLKIITKIIDFPLKIIKKFKKLLERAPAKNSLEKFREKSGSYAHRRVRSKSSL